MNSARRSSCSFGTWFDHQTPQWETYLSDAPESVIRKTGLPRKQLKQVLQVLYENRVIN
jgi:hypothetical protein